MSTSRAVVLLAGLALLGACAGPSTPAGPSDEAARLDAVSRAYGDGDGGAVWDALCPAAVAQEQVRWEDAVVLGDPRALGSARDSFAIEVAQRVSALRGGARAELRRAEPLTPAEQRARGAPADRPAVRVFLVVPPGTQREAVWTPDGPDGAWCLAAG